MEGLCPEETYPKQMRQAALALEHLLSLGYSPSQVSKPYHNLI